MMKLWLWVFAIFLVSRIAAVPNAVPTERISGSAGDVLEDNPVGRLKVYVYDLPSKYNKKTLQKDPRCLTHMFAAEIYMHRFLLNSPVRTLNPDEADWFYTPIYVTCDLTPNGLPLPFKSPRMMRSAIQLISSNWPYWNRTEGADHFFVVPHDFGACFHYQEEKAIDRGILPLLQRATLVQTFGQRNHVCLNEGSITIPPYCPPQKMKTHLIPSETPRSIFVYFRGLFYDVNNDPEGGYYARGARAAVWENFKNNPLFDISTDHPTTYYEDMQRAIFCLCPLGWAPWSPRLVEAVVFGCIPVIIADDIVLPFADAIPWEEIGVFVDEKDVSNLDTILTSIPPDVILRKQRLLANPSMKRAMMFPSPTSGGRCNPIPESDENEDDEEQDSAVEFQGFFATSAPLASPRLPNIVKNVEVSLLPEAAVIAAGRSYETYAVVLKVKAPAQSATTSSSPMNRSLRPPIDLVTVLDVSASANSAKLQMVKRTMRLVISSLGCTDRLSIVAFSASSKRLLSLRRMTSNGRRSARRIVDLLCEVGQGACINDAIKKAAKVLEDRRERNPAASIILISDGRDDRVGASYSGNYKRCSPFVCSTRFPHLEIPVHAISFGDGLVPPEEALANCIRGLLSVVVQDLRLQLGFVSGSTPGEIAAVYSLSSRPTVLEPGSIRIGDLCSEEVREMLVELKVPVSSLGSHPLLSVRSAFKDTSSQSQALLCSKQHALPVPRPRTVRSSGSNIQRLRNLHLTIRAVAESQRLIEHNDFSAAQHLLSSARALLLKQSGSTSASEYIKGLDVESAALSRRKQQQMQTQRQNAMAGRETSRVDEKIEQLTPTSAWRAAERLAKVAIMRKSMNRVSDLHGFEDARF